MEGHFSYNIGGEERKFFFGNYALEETLTEFNASVSDMATLLDTKLLPFLRAFIYHAAAYPILKAGNRPDFTPFDVHDWIDLTGGANGDFIIQSSKKIYASLGVGESEEVVQSEKKSKS